jgi:hypothetical protein
MNNQGSFFQPNFDEKKSDPRERGYKMRAMIKIVERTYDDVQSRGNLGRISRKFVYLIPDLSDQMTGFFTAWLGPVCKGCPLHPPAIAQDCSQPLIEVLFKFPHPFGIVARCSVENPSVIFPEDHHLFLMTEGLAKLIIARPQFNNQWMWIESLPASTDHPDGAPTDGNAPGEDLPFEKRKY